MPQEASRYTEVPLDAQTSSAIKPISVASLEEARHEAAEAAAHLAAAAHIVGTGNAALAAFFTGFTRYASPEDLNHYTGPELAALIKRAFAVSGPREPGTSLVAILDPSADDPAFARSETVVIAVNDDIPFLYDSCTAEVRSQGLSVAAAFHPVIAIARDNKGKSPESSTTRSESVIVLALNARLDESHKNQLRDGLLKVFGDVRAAVRDWKPMLNRLAETVTELKNNPPPIPEAELAENLAFLAWLKENHFTFLGCRDYVFSPEGEGRLDARYESGLGLLANPDMSVVRRGKDRSSLTPDLREFLTQPAPLIIAKSSTRSTVHRRTHMDYVGIKTFDGKGRLTGERRFIGLFTSAAYSQLPAEIPLLRRKVHHVLAGSGLPPASHDGKALAHIIDTFPRDELFQIAEDELLSTALGILNLGDRPKVRLFLRFDKFDRYVSALAYIPRDRYNGAVQAKIHTLLATAFDGRESAAIPMLDDEALARIHYIVGRNPGARPEADVREIEAAIRAAIRTWEDGFADAVAQAYGDGKGPLAQRYANAFPAGYRDTFTPWEAAQDIERIEQVLAGEAKGGHLAAHVYGREGGGPNALHLKLFVRGPFVPLSECLPVFEKLGLKVIAEDAFALTPFPRMTNRRQSHCRTS